MTDRIIELIKEERGRLEMHEVEMARLLATHFPRTYGVGAYKLKRLGRRWGYPEGVDAELLGYVSVVFGATYLRDRFQCVYCGLSGFESAGHYAAIQIDHLVPVGRRAQDEWKRVPEVERFIVGYSPDNLACACATCNVAKSDELLGGVTLKVPRHERLERARSAERARRVVERGRPKTKYPSRYETEVSEVAAFVAAYDAMIKFVRGGPSAAQR